MAKSRNPDFKTQMNKQTKIVESLLLNHRNQKWHRTLDNLTPNDGKLFQINRGLLSK